MTLRKMVIDVRDSVKEAFRPPVVDPIAQAAQLAQSTPTKTSPPKVVIANPTTDPTLKATPK
jgi:hypothetical protein